MSHAFGTKTPVSQQRAAVSFGRTQRKVAGCIQMFRVDVSRFVWALLAAGALTGCAGADMTLNASEHRIDHAVDAADDRAVRAARAADRADEGSDDAAG